MFDRILTPSAGSFSLFGPRATGKSTWLKHRFPEARRLDLLRSELFFELSSRPGHMREIVTARPKGSLVVIDEVQRIPALLDEVNSLMEDEGYRFALSGSSARKLAGPRQSACWS